MKEPYAYIFRFCCDPGFNDEAELKALRRYAREARVDDVAVFANVEELNTGHMTYGEQDAYLSLMRRVRDAMAEQGVSMSVNQWHSVMHADLGKRFRPEQSFRPMVDPNGRAASLCVCPLCAEWQNYIAGLYARYAALGPSIVWVEDDFRLHNHEPLAWGGCFCDEHMKLYSERAGKPLTREEFVQGVLQPGAPHPYRKIWLDVSRETMLSAARAIGEAVRTVSPSVRVGLMSSAPHVHAAEGRDWHALLKTLAAGQPPVDRIHLPGYQETSPAQYLHGFNMVSMLTKAMLPEDTLVYPELENYPFSLFSKSRRFTRFQLLSSLALAPDGITIDLYDLNGNGIVREDGYQDMLRETKPYLNALTASGVLRGRRRGVRVLYCPDSAYTVHTREGRSMEELYPQEAFFAALLPAMGVPCAYCCEPAALSGEVVAASGQVLRNWDDGVIERLFAENFVILTGDAAEVLCDRGLGVLAGIESLRWMRQNEGEYTFEQVTNGRGYDGRLHARASAVISCSDALCVSYRPDAEVREYTAFYDSLRRRTAPCQTVVNGRVLIYPFGHFESPTALPPMLFNRVRQEVLHDVLREAGFDAPVVRGAPYLEPYCFETERGLALYLVNGSSDAVPCVTLRGAPDGEASAFGSRDAAPSRVRPEPLYGARIYRRELPAMEALLLTWNTGKGETI